MQRSGSRCYNIGGFIFSAERPPHCFFRTREDQLIRKTLSAFCASSLEYVSAVSSSHSLSEAMLFLSLTLFGLVSSKHFLHLLIVVCNPGSRDIRNSSGSVSLYSQITLYTMTSYIKPYFTSFVKRFFKFLWIFCFFAKKLCLLCTIYLN